MYRRELRMKYSPYSFAEVFWTPPPPTPPSPQSNPVNELTQYSKLKNSFIV
jgi:hypothetical protein